MNKTAILEAVNSAIEMKISVVPPAQDGSKRPDVPSWKRYQEKCATRAQSDHWYSNGRTGVGWVCGAVSGNLEVMDFDDRQIYEEYKEMAISVGLGALVERVESGYLEHSPKGVHWPYRCSEIAGNTKLAKRAAGRNRFDSLIETRGERGFIIVAPSHGGVNDKGVYELVRGSVETITTITAEERKQLHGLARAFDELTEPAQEREFSASSKEGRPGDDFAARTPWEEILRPHGWEVVFRRHDITHWRRPGKRVGISATTNYADSDLLYVFSTSTIFDAERGIGKFAAYALLNHDGDFAAAASDLRLEGYGAEEPLVEVDLSGILQSISRKKVEKPTPFPDALLDVPGLVGDMSKYINSVSAKPQPVLALGAALAAVGTIIGRKTRTENLLRSNIYILSVGETGCGKEAARQAIRRVFEAAGAGARSAYDEIASDAGINSALKATPSCVFLLDEAGRMFKAMASDRAPAHIANQVSAYLKLFGAADGVYYGKTYADRDSWIVIEQPNLSIYGTTVPGRLYESMTSAQVADGFLSRFLVFESNNPDPEYTHVTDNKPPDALVEQFAKWEQRSENANPNAGNLEALKPDPLVVPATPGAQRVFRDLEAEMKRVRGEMRERHEDPGMYTRVSASAQKLALIRACGRAFDSPQIDEDDATWGAKLALYLFDNIVRKIAANVSDNAIEAQVQRVGEIIRKAGTITKSQLTRRTQWLRRQERNDVIGTLMDSQQITATQSETGGKTKLTSYTWRGR